MKKLLYLFPIVCLMCHPLVAQYEYEVSKENPYGKLNPKAPPELADFDDLIGSCECKSVLRVDQSTWADTVAMTWVFKYIMNGMAVQDETWKVDDTYAGSIRQYNSDSSAWYVHFYSSSAAVPTLPAWKGGKVGDDIVLYRNSPAPNGMEGFYRLTFSDISENGYNWAGEWVNPDETIVYPTWRIFCTKKKKN